MGYITVSVSLFKDHQVKIWRKLRLAIVPKKYFSWMWVNLLGYLNFAAELIPLGHIHCWLMFKSLRIQKELGLCCSFSNFSQAVITAVAQTRDAVRVCSLDLAGTNLFLSGGSFRSGLGVPFLSGESRSWFVGRSSQSVPCQRQRIVGSFVLYLLMSIHLTHNDVFLHGQPGCIVLHHTPRIILVPGNAVSNGRCISPVRIGSLMVNNPVSARNSECLDGCTVQVESFSRRVGPVH